MGISCPPGPLHASQLASPRRVSGSCGDAARLRPNALVPEGHIMPKIVSLKGHRDLRIHGVLILVVDGVRRHDIRSSPVSRILNDRVFAWHQVEQPWKAVL